MTMDHATLHELAAGAALDDLDPSERGQLDDHLTTCSSCRRLSAELDDVVGELALVAPALHPPAELRGQVLAAIHQSAGPRLTLVPAATAAGSVRTRSSTVAPTITPADGHPARRTAVTRWAGLAAAAVFAFAAVGLGVQNQQLSEEAAAANVALAEANAELGARQAAVAVALDPAHVTVTLHAEPVAAAANAVVMFRPGTTDAYLMATELPATPAGQVYQLWFADAAGVHALGTFHHDGQGPFVAPFGVDLASSAAAMVTLEPEGGAVGEPGPQVVFGEF